MKKIYDLAFQFRHAIDNAKKDGALRNTFLEHFPQGCCGHTSELLAQFLKENGVVTVYYYGTNRDYGFENIHSHAWLQVANGIIIDITGDQFCYYDIFNNFNQSVYVGPANSFHDLFEVEKRDVCESYDFILNSNNELIKVYDIICCYM